VAPGESCSGVLRYLNNLNSVGKTYCGSTEIRMGWTVVRCGKDAAGAGGIYGSPGTHGAQQPKVNPGMESYGTTGTTPAGGTVQPTQPQVVQPGAEPVVVPSGMIMQVRMDEPVGEQPWGQPVSASLSQDLVVGDEVVAPAGAALRAWVSQPDPAVAADPTDMVLQLDSVVYGGEEHPLVAEGTSGGAVAVSVPVALEKVDVELGPATPLLPPDVKVGLTAESVQGYRQAIVAANLQLSELESVNFWPMYREYRSAVEQVNARRFQLIQDFAATYETLQGEEAVAMLEQALDIEADHLDLKQTWLPRFEEILPGNKVVRFFQIEGKLESVVRSSVAEMVPLVH
jgi:hypothetical protein